MIDKCKTYLTKRGLPQVNVLNGGKSATSYKRVVFAVAFTFMQLTLTPLAKADDCINSVGELTESLPRDCLQNPGWLDVGAGIVVIQDAGASRQNGVGNLVTLRAYPFARWYAAPKPRTAKNSVVEAKLAIAKQLSQKAAQSDENAKELRQKAAQSDENAKELRQKAAQSDEDAKKLSPKAGQISPDAAKANSDAAAAHAAADEANSDAAAAHAAADEANADAARAMQTALDDFGNNYALKELGWEQVARRVSVFLGRSVGGFDPNVVNGDITAFGVAFDVAPQFSIVWGRAYFNLPEQAGVADSSKSGTVVGVQINLNAFKAMRGITGSL